MARSPFSIYTRKGTQGQTLFCVRFYDEAGNSVKSVTLADVKSKSMAGRAATRMLADGIVSTSSNPFILDYLEGFWARGSDYVDGRALRGHELSDQYLKVSRYLISKHLKGPLQGKRMQDITPALTEKLILAMSRGGAQPRTVNTTIQALRVPFTYFCRQHRIVNSMIGIEKLRETQVERGTLTADELGRVIALDDMDVRAKAAFLLGALCGLRLGEVRCLQWDDIDEAAGTINVRLKVVNKRLKDCRAAKGIYQYNHAA